MNSLRLIAGNRRGGVALVCPRSFLSEGRHKEELWRQEAAFPTTNLKIKNVTPQKY